jgi:hypothetical protein
LKEGKTMTFSTTYPIRKKKPGSTLYTVLCQAKKQDYLVQGQSVRTIGEILEEIDFETADQRPLERVISRSLGLGVRQLVLADEPGTAVALIVPHGLVC